MEEGRGGYSIATHRMPPLGGPGNTQLVFACIAGRSSGLRTLQPSAEFLLTVASRSQFLAISANHGVRFRLPLRGSLGFKPSSLLSAY